MLMLTAAEAERQPGDDTKAGATEEGLAEDAEHPKSEVPETRQAKASIHHGANASVVALGATIGGA